MSGLPNTRPIATTFGPDVVNDDPVLDPTLETDAAIFNLIRNALAFCGQVVALTVTSFTGATGVVRTTRGGTCTCTVAGPGDYTIDATGGWNFSDAEASVQSADVTLAPPPAPHVQVITATQARVRTYNNAGTPTHQNFLFKAW